MEKDTVISIRDLKKSFDKKEVLKGINLSIGKGDFTEFSVKMVRERVRCSSTYWD